MRRMVRSLEFPLDKRFLYCFNCDMEKSPALKEAIEKAGSASALARLLGVTPQAVGQWKRAPAERVLLIEQVMEGKVTRYDLRPDIYGTKDKQEVAAAQ